jgi:hypothetical protein
MNRRAFLTTAGALASGAAAAATQSPPGRVAPPTLLTITGSIGKTNRPAFDPARDILMGKHSIAFDKAFAIDHPMLERLPSTRIDVTLEYDRRRHALGGPLLTDVLELAGAATGNTIALNLRAVDGYAPTLALADARRYRYIVAMQMDGKPLALGGLGPLWAVYEADRFPEVAVKPVDQRFATCPWAMYHVDVRNA